ncbi:MAG: hypothetical protein ACI9UV_001603, partial [Algoriphagus sp.]
KKIRELAIPVMISEFFIKFWLFLFGVITQSSSQNF